ncbi:MAG: hypothetical protein C4586_08245 [Anaerolineaceae bacterium]|nr:MAG: hypothetical protein C4586_08245 [Anaerolineaceae bacterium]
MSTSDIRVAVDSNLDTLDDSTTTAIDAINAYMPTLNELAAQAAPYFQPGTVSYPGTTPNFSSVEIPAFTQLTDSDTALSSADTAVDQIPSPDAKTNDLLSDMQGKLSDAEARLDSLQIATDEITTPNANDMFDEQSYIADLIASVQSQIQNSLSSAAGSSTAKESFYYTNDRSRRNAANQKEMTDVMAEFSGRGFSLPSDILADAASYIGQRQTMDDADADREIIMQQDALSIDNKQRAIAAGLRYDQILIGYFQSKAIRALSIAKTILKLGQDLAALKLAVIDGRTEMQRANVGMISDGRKISMEEFREKTRAFALKLDAIISVAGGYMDAYQADGYVYGITQRAAAEVPKFDQSENKIKMETLMWNIEQAIRVLPHNLQAFMDIVDVRMGTIKTGTAVQKALASAAKGSVTSVISMLSGEKTEAQVTA